MNTYTVTIKLPTEKAFLRFLNDVGPLANQMVLSVENSPEPAGEVFHAKQAAPPRQRTSKVNNAILDALTFKNCNVKELKEALEAAKMSSGSLSTGLSTLQKSGEVVRLGDGLYGLASKQPQQAKAAE